MHTKSVHTRSEFGGTAVDTDNPRASRATLTLSEFQPIFNAELNRFLCSKVSDPVISSAPDLVREALEQSVRIVTGGGKRIRPYLAYLAYVTDGGIDLSELIRVSVSLEMIHAFALIHDDIIDRGVMRHGQETTHQYVARQGAKRPRGDKDHLGEGVALLIGDLFFSWAHEVAVSSGNPSVIRLLFRLVDEVVTGQLIDVSLMFESDVSLETLARKNELKTARYTFVNPLLIGAALAGSGERTAWYESFGLLIGQAYQIQDDLLDVVGTESKLGKQPFIDVADGQHTLLTQFVFTKGDRAAREAVMRVFGSALSDADRAMLTALFTDTGAVAYAQAEIDRLLGEADRLISDAGFNNPVDWHELLRLVRNRNS